jgi:hypothetical protein
MASSNAVTYDYTRELDHMAPATYHAKLGTVLTNWAGAIGACVVDDAAQIVTLGQILADMTAMRTKFAAFLAHVDTGNVAGIGNSNASTYTPAALTTVVPTQTSVAPTPLGG